MNAAATSLRQAAASKGLPWITGLLCWCCVQGAAAAADDESTLAEELREPVATQFEVSRTDIARTEFSTQDVARLGRTIGTNNTTRLDLTGWAWPHRQAGLGLSLGMEMPAPRPWADPRASSGMDLGVRWRWAMDDGRRFDVATSRRMTAPDAVSLIESSQQVGLYRTRVEMQFVTGRSRIAPEFGAIGMQLDSGAKLSLRTKHGKPMLYYRSKF